MNTGIICGSTSRSRQSHKVALHLEELAQQWEDFHGRMIDLADYPVPLDESSTLTERLQQFDNFILVFDARNQSYPLSLRLMLEQAQAAFSNKVVAVSIIADDSETERMAYQSITSMLLGLQAVPLSTRLLVTKAEHRFDQNLNVPDPLFGARMDAFLETFLSFFREPLRVVGLNKNNPRPWMRLAQ
jgi:NAD(P)H-dependent FMN reductase